MSRRAGSPTLELNITPEQYATAVQSKSGGCLVADAIKKQYPHLSSVSVDMATIRVSDRKRGERYAYLTPEPVQKLLLYYDQGWGQTMERFVIRRAVKITKITSRLISNLKREEKKAALEAKLASGEELTRSEKSSLTRLRNSKTRPTREGKTTVSGPATQRMVVRGGRQIPRGPTHPNLLRGRDRIFGAKQSDPGEVFTQAVEDAVQAKLAEMGVDEVAAQV